MFPAEDAPVTGMMGLQGVSQEGNGLVRARQGRAFPRRALPALRDAAVYPFFHDVAYTATVTRVSRGFGDSEIIESMIPGTDTTIISVYSLGGEGHWVHYTGNNRIYTASTVQNSAVLEVHEYDIAAAAVRLSELELEYPKGGVGRIPDDGTPPTAGNGTPPRLGVTELDVMMVFDAPAVAYAGTKGGTTVFANALVAQMNAVLRNSGLSCEVNLVEVYCPDYVGTRAAADADMLYTALEDVTYGRGALGGVAARRDAVGADLVCLMVGGSSGIAGVAWSPEVQGHLVAKWGFSVCNINYVEVTDSLIHEIGHNIGCGHSRAQDWEAGPQFHAYSSGSYFMADGVRHCTIMSYEVRGDGYVYARVPYFSSPGVYYQDVEVGSAVNDNARTFRQNMATVAAYKNRPDPVSPPSTVAATADDTAKVRVTWSRVSASPAVSYKVYRSTVNASSSATPIQTVGSSVQVFDDTDVTFGTPYYYWVKTVSNSVESVFSMAAAGGLHLLFPPTGVTASFGMYEHKVRVTWDPSEGATAYFVYRNTVNNRESATRVAILTASVFNDPATVEGTTYYYWVKAHNSAGESDFSMLALGTRAASYRHSPYLSAPGSEAPLITTAYDGFMYDDEGIVRGTLTLNAKAAVKVDKKAGTAVTNWTFSAKVIGQAATVSFSGKAEGVADRFVATTKEGELDVALESGRIYGTVSSGKVGGTFTIEGARSVFADKKDTAAQERLKEVMGLYNIELLNCGVAKTMGYMSMTVGNAGVVKIAGGLSDGTQISGKAKLLEGLNENGWYAVVLYSPLYSKKGFVGGLLWLNPENGVIHVDHEYNGCVEWKCEDPKQVPFHYELCALGGYFSDGKAIPPVPQKMSFRADIFDTNNGSGLPSPDPKLLYGEWMAEAFPWALPVTVGGGAKLSLDKATAPKKVGSGAAAYWEYKGANPSGATLAYTAKTGIFKGTFNIYYDGYDAKGALQHKTVKVNYTGLMVPYGGMLYGNGFGALAINKQKFNTHVFLY